MNLNNYATLEASKRLAEAGIVVETDFFYKIFDDEVTFITKRERDSWLAEVKRGNASPTAIFIPALSLAEVWRELPESQSLHIQVGSVLQRRPNETHRRSKVAIPSYSGRFVP